MIPRPHCVRRRCKHFLGVSEEGNPDKPERPFCKAFPDGIPVRIAYGDDLHIEPTSGDNGIQYEVHE
jgi:hypothetical protein